MDFAPTSTERSQTSPAPHVLSSGCPTTSPLQSSCAHCKLKLCHGTQLLRCQHVRPTNHISSQKHLIAKTSRMWKIGRPNSSPPTTKAMHWHTHLCGWEVSDPSNHTLHLHTGEHLYREVYRHGYFHAMLLAKQPARQLHARCARGPTRLFRVFSEHAPKGVLGVRRCLGGHNASESPARFGFRDTR